MALNADLVTEIFQAVRGRFTLAEIEDLLENNPEELIRLVELYTTQEFQSRMVPEIEQQILESGSPLRIADLLPTGGLLAPFLFSLASPATAVAITTYTRDDIATISSNTSLTIRQMLRRPASAALTPQQLAREVAATLGLTPRQETAVANYRAALINRDRSALRNRLRDQRSDSTVRAAITEDRPLTMAQINKLTSGYRARLLRFRAGVIARTEQARAASVGERYAILQAFQQGVLPLNLRRQWVFTHDSLTRHWHIGIPPLNPGGIRITEQYLTEPPGRVEFLEFPRDPRGFPDNVIECRCRERYFLV